MTEAEWLACDDPAPMLRFLWDELTERQARLFAVACCREVWPLLVDGRSRAAVELAEQFADRRTKTWARLTRAEVEAWHVAGVLLSDPPRAAAARAAALSAVSAARRGDWWLRHQTAWGTISAEAVPARQEEVVRARQADLLRDVAGHPHRHIVVYGSCLTPTVQAVAAGAYESRAFNELPVLADALEEAGCAEATLLAHLRGPGPHVRGCWALDLILGRT